MKRSRFLLKRKFKDGSRPTQNDFVDFIDSTFISGDDGITLFDNGLMLTKRNASGNKEGEKYQIVFGDRTLDGKIQELEFSWAGSDKTDLSKIKDNEYRNTDPLLTINQRGISAKSIIINEIAEMKGRQGNFVQADVLKAPPNPTDVPNAVSPITCDGTWQPILNTRKVCQAYEIVAQLDGTTQSVLYAIASTSKSVNTNKNVDKQLVLDRLDKWISNTFKSIFGKTNNKVKVLQCYSDWCEDKIKIQWVEDYNSFSLQVKAKEKI